MTSRKEISAVGKFILRNIPSHPRTISRMAQDEFGISRQAVAKHLTELERVGLVGAQGATRARVYFLAETLNKKFSYSLNKKLEEHEIWEKDIGPLLSDLPPDTKDIWHYGVTEIINNAIDHSGGRTVEIQVIRDAIKAEILVADDGYGLFRKIQDALDLKDVTHAVLELSKGKFTTDPENHTGEGIFFTSRSTDKFSIIASGVYASHEEIDHRSDWVMDTGDDAAPGTLVGMELQNETNRKLEDIFDKFASDDEEYVFSKTTVPVSLVRFGSERVVSRSQAKRLLSRIDRFNAVLLDFSGIDKIGQAFADEVFRVFVRAHPKIEISHVNASKNVEKMIRRVRSAETKKSP